MAKIWVFDSDLRYKEANDISADVSSLIDMIYWRNDIFYIYSNLNLPFIGLIDVHSKQFFLRYSNDKKSVKVTDFDDDYYNFKSQLNGHRISAATDVTLNDTTFVYLFAGRMLCRQELSEQFVKVCDIEDIADWIGCSEDISDNIDTLLIVLGLFVTFVLVLIIALIVGLFFVFRNRESKLETDPKAQSKSLATIIKSDLKSKDVIEPDPIQ